MKKMYTSERHTDGNCWIINGPGIENVISSDPITKVLNIAYNAGRENHRDEIMQNLRISRMEEGLAAADISIYAPLVIKHEHEIRVIFGENNDISYTNFRRHPEETDLDELSIAFVHGYVTYLKDTRQESINH